MSDTNKTITDIIKKIRAEADYIEESARGSLKAGETMAGTPFTESDLESALDSAESKRKEADRLEAALKRELAEKDAEIAKLRCEIDLCRGTGAASKARDLIEEMHRIHRLCSETDGDNWKQKIGEISYKASWY